LQNGEFTYVAGDVRFIVLKQMTNFLHLIKGLCSLPFPCFVKGKEDTTTSVPKSLHALVPCAARRSVQWLIYLGRTHHGTGWPGDRVGGSVLRCGEETDENLSSIFQTVDNYFTDLYQYAPRAQALPREKMSQNLKANGASTRSSVGTV
jgi:hypothetical protein